ncbi:LysM domain-containing protein [Agromyces sp. CF514]|uniref:LysM peptidoglycan-binding domain-containing protein n=1 Tax=Agromyces sp. CF514 TaxID=1881031 RepID=UPI0008E9D320|nr:LysM peptidoglycan-binding domain-containing protein [Agromyces sp. CF514]SFR88722.1 LysM domain-containing protein [Agromyces sp. CF514]
MSAVLVAGPFGSYTDRVVAADVAIESSVVRSRLRLTRRGRAVFTVLAALPLVLLVISFVLGSGGAAADVDGVGAGASSLAYLTVADGESLWSIAESLAPQGDPRELIDEIVRLNGLDDTVVQPGQRLALPAQP